MTTSTESRLLGRNCRIDYDSIDGLESMIQSGSASLCKMADVAGVSRQAIHDYLRRTSQHPMWKRKRTEFNANKSNPKKERQAILNDIGDLLCKDLHERAKSASWPEQRISDYTCSFKRFNGIAYKPEFVLKMFQRYEELKKQGIKYSLDDFGNEFGLWFPTVGEIFRRANVDPMYGAHRRGSSRYKMPLHLKERMKRIVNIEFSPADVAHFLGSYRHHIYRELKKLGRTTIRNPSGPLTYRRISQIYEAQDVGFTPGEISDYVGIRKFYVNRALSKRQELEPKMINSLRLLLQNPGISKPYV